MLLWGRLRGWKNFTTSLWCKKSTCRYSDFLFCSAIQSSHWHFLNHQFFLCKGLCASELVWCKQLFCLQLTVQADEVSNVFVHCLKASYMNFSTIMSIKHSTNKSEHVLLPSIKVNIQDIRTRLLLSAKAISVKAWLTHEATIKYRQQLSHVQPVSEDHLLRENWILSSSKINYPL